MRKIGKKISADDIFVRAVVFLSDLPVSGEADV